MSQKDHKNTSRSGFTLIELMLSMGFVAALLIAITMTVVQVSNIYNRGITIKAVNQAGRSVSADIQKSINQLSSFDISPPTVPDPYTDYVRLTSGSDEIGGRLCVGQYTYIWNYGEFLEESVPGINKYTSAVDGSTLVRFAKIPDSDGSYCQKDPSTGLYDNINGNDSVELLSGGDRDLVVHNFRITEVTKDPVTNQTLYQISFIIGTNEQQLINSGYICKAPGEAGSSARDLSYCAINEFNFMARSGNIVQ